MAIHARLFDREKAIEAILFIAHSLPNATMHSISKIFYLADKQHLQDYGRLICGDRYIAMEYGPVPSAIYDMMKVPTGRIRIDPDIDDFIIEAFTVVLGRNILPKRQPEMALISESEIDCIEQIIHQHGQKTFGQLTDMTHDSAWDSTEENQPISLIDIAKTLDHSAELVAYLEAH